MRVTDVRDRGVASEHRRERCPAGKRVVDHASPRCHHRQTTTHSRPRRAPPSPAEGRPGPRRAKPRAARAPRRAPPGPTRASRWHRPANGGQTRGCILGCPHISL
jgi:hypothetical protein